jgi:hypothetical protein
MNKGNNNQPRRVYTQPTTSTTSRPPTTSTSKGTNSLNIIPPPFIRSTGQNKPGSRVSSSRKNPPLPPRLLPNSSSISSISMSSFDGPINITENIKKNESVIDFDNKDFNVFYGFLRFEKEDGTYQIEFPKGYDEVTNQIYLGKKNGKYYIGIKRMPYNTIEDRKYEKLCKNQTVHQMNTGIQTTFRNQSYSSPHHKR